MTQYNDNLMHSYIVKIVELDSHISKCLPKTRTKQYIICRLQLEHYYALREIREIGKILIIT